jgi:hypothetical protein
MEKLIIMSTLLHLILLGQLNQLGFDGKSMQHTWGKWEIHTKFWLENFKGRDHIGHLDVDGWKVFK